jgi:hypothetical protein
MSEIERSMGAIGLFKDWSNYLLVTTVAAIGWVSTRNNTDESGLLQLSLWLLAASAVLGVFTLALLPLIAEALDYNDHGVPLSMYFTKVESHVLNVPIHIYLTQVCRPQHVTFILGVLAYAAAESGMRWDTQGIVLFVVGLLAVVLYGVFSRPTKDRPQRWLSSQPTSVSASVPVHETPDTAR